MGGISLGNFAFLSTTKAKKVASIMHEQEGHTYDSKLFGPLYLFVIGLPSLLLAIYCHDMEKYYTFYTEKWANKHANLEILTTANGKVFLSVKNVLGYKRKK